jgi:haloalkane dehalogenase
MPSLPSLPLVERTACADLAALDLPSFRVEIDGAPVSFVDKGTGPVLLFVHGAPGWSFTWRGVVNRLADEFRCVALDLPGFGLSPARPAHRILEDTANVVRRFVEVLDLRDVTLVANDTGGAVGFGAACAIPERFRALVAAGTLAFALDDLPRLRRAVWLFSSGPARLVNRWLNVIVRGVTSFGTPRKRWDPEERTAYLRPFASRAARDRCARMLGALVREPDYLPRLEGALGAIAALPLLTLFGEADPARRLGVPGKFARLFADCTDRTIPGAMHFAHEDDPGAFAEHLRRWAGERRGHGPARMAP